MTARSKLSEATPFAVEDSIKALGARLKRARLRRGLSMDDVSNKIGVSRQVVSDAENGKVTTSIAVYTALLWVLDLLPHLDTVADPALDEVGAALAAFREPKRASGGRGGLDNDF